MDTVNVAVPSAFSTSTTSAIDSTGKPSSFVIVPRPELSVMVNAVASAI